MKPRLLLGATAALGAVFVAGVVAYACIPIATLNLSASSVSPGSQVTASIHAISSSSGPPVVFHWASVDGPVLATATPTDSGTSAVLTVPSVTQSGDYLIVATQALKPGSTTWGMPVRAVLHVDVVGAPAAPASSGGLVGQSGPAGLTTESGMGTGVLVLIAVATAAFGLLVVGGATVLTGRRAGAAEAVRKG